MTKVLAGRSATRGRDRVGAGRPGPGKEPTATAQGHPRAAFQRAIEHGDLAVADATAREMGRVTLLEALELTALIAFKDPRRHGRAAARWLRRFLDEHPDVTIEEAALAAAALQALGGRRHEQSLLALRAMGATASLRPRPRRVR